MLSGRCHESESVPYKAFDGVIDHLSHHLAGELPAAVGAILHRRVAHPRFGDHVELAAVTTHLLARLQRHHVVLRSLALRCVRSPGVRARAKGLFERMVDAKDKSATFAACPRSVS